VREVESAHQALIDAGQPVEILPDGSMELKNSSSIERPEDINRMLVNAGTPPTQLIVEEEGLEEYFLRLVGMEGGLQNE
jgi:ABC-2 type transport system ATP-binding protein